MNYIVTLDQFEGPLDLLLHLIKETKMSIYDIELEEIVRQYLETIQKMESLNLDIASAYLVMAAELIEIKSKMLLPKPVLENDETEEDPRQQLIERLLEYKAYKEMTPTFREKEQERKNYYTKTPTILKAEDWEVEPRLTDDLSLDDLLTAFAKFMERKQQETPITTKVTTKEYSVAKRSHEIRQLLSLKKQIKFEELFDTFTKDYLVVTFLSILDLAKKQELTIEQKENFKDIYLSIKEV